MSEEINLQVKRLFVRHSQEELSKYKQSSGSIEVSNKTNNILIKKLNDDIKELQQELEQINNIALRYVEDTPDYTVLDKNKIGYRR